MRYRYPARGGCELTGGGRADLPVREVPDGLLIAVRLKPNSRKEGIEGIDDRKGALIVRVRGKALKGEANRCLLDLLGKELGVRGVRIVSGSRSRDKTVHVPSGGAERERILRAAERLACGR